MKKLTLKNGLRILLDPDKNAKTASICMTVGVGSRMESPEQAGISHFVEHMLYSGTTSRSRSDINDQISAMSASYNGETSKEYTRYYFQVLENQQEAAADLLFDMLLHPAFDPKETAVERGIICSELDMRDGGQSPVGYLMDNIWPKSQLVASTGGVRETVSKITPDTLRAFMAKYYVPERMVFSACGKLNEGLLLRKIKNQFGKLPNTKNPISAEPAPCKRFIQKIPQLSDKLALGLCFPTFGSRDERYYALDILEHIISSSPSGRLFARIREELGLVYSIRSGKVSFLNEGIFAIEMVVDADNEITALLEIGAILYDIKTNGVTQKEFQRAKHQLTDTLTMDLDNNLYCAIANGEDELLYNGALGHAEKLKKYNSVTLQEVNRLAAELIDFTQTSLVAAGSSPCDSDFYKSILDELEVLNKEKK
ncbi:MAG: insulinase family protein [Oscillospiraceae bacterium]|jgi:predicted Zn-dependent peptidase|nr:insulinase family protein [Oscillospiraceae bacterium]